MSVRRFLTVVSMSVAVIGISDLAQAQSAASKGKAAAPPKAAPTPAKPAAATPAAAGGAEPTLVGQFGSCLLYTSPSPRDGLLSRMPSSA